MTKANALIVTCLLLFAVSGTALSSTDTPASVNAGQDRRGSELSPGLDGVEAPPVGGCRDIAFTEIFKSEGLGYVSSAEFALAVRAVATGDSKYSPNEIPPDWSATVDRGSCSPSLIYLASMEYRSKAGRPELTPVFPVYLREATRDLVARADAKRQLAGRFTERAGAIATKLRDAERMGAADCAPGRLAEAKANLDRARREAAGVRSSVQETESFFVRAEQIADTLVTRQQFALNKGLKCYAE